MRILATTFFLIFSSLAHSQQTNDTLFLTNGSMIIGELDYVKFGVVRFDPLDANDITVQLRKLKTIAGSSQVFRIEALDNQLYFGKISAHPQANMIYIISGTDSLSLDLEEISILYPLEKKIWQRFSGSVGLGYSYTRTSGFGRLNYDGKVNYQSRRSLVGFGVSGIYTIYDSLFSRDKENIFLKYNFYFSGNWFATIYMAYQRNLELALQRRFQEGIGIGNKFITSRYVYAFGRGGIAINQEKSTEGVASGTLTELFGQVEVNIFRFNNPEINIVFEQAFFYSLSETGRFRNDGSMSMTWEIFKDFDLNLEPYNSYDSKPPVEGSTKFDFGVVFGVKYTF